MENLVGACSGNGSDKAVQELLDHAGKYLGIAIANLIGILDVSDVRMSGPISQFGDLLLNKVIAEVKHRVLPSMADRTRISYTTVDSDAVLPGGFAMQLYQPLYTKGSAGS